MQKLPIKFIFSLAAVLLFCSVTQAQIPGKIVYTDDPGRILIINADGTGQTQLTTGQTLFDTDPVYSPDGSRIAFSRNISLKTEICIMNGDGTNVVTVTSGEVTPSSFNSHPSWSPDGTKIVFMSNRSGFGKSEIWLMNADGSGLVQLTTNIQKGSNSQGPVFSFDRSPAWSPDGSKIAFASNRDGSDTEIYVMNVDGSNPVKLTDDGLDDDEPAWSPDSQRIAFTKGQGSGINIINRDGTNLVNVILAHAPAWSPDGTRLAFIQFEPISPFKGNVFTAKIDGTDKQRVSNNPNGAHTPSWAPSSSPPIPTFTISGLVKDTNGAPISGATLSMFVNGTRTTQSDSTGAYSFPGLPTGTYTINISKSGYGFTQTSITLTNINSDQTANFNGFVAFTISGVVSGTGSGLRVTLSGSESRSVFTDIGGVYAFNLVPAGGNYTVSINTPFFIVSPPSISINNLSANATANFSAVIATYSISGTVRRRGLPKPGITMRLSDASGFPPKTTTTDANGHYEFPNLVAGRSYVVQPSDGNYLADDKGVPTLDSDKIVDFDLKSANNILLERADFKVVEGVPSLQVFVHRGGNCCGVGPITIDYATADGTAKAGLDYTAVSGTLNFPEGTFSQTITIPILSDQVYEGGAEQFSISLSNATGEVDIVSPSNAVVTIGEMRLITESNSDRAIALNNASQVVDPFSLTTEPNFSTDQRTRVSLFLEDFRGFQSLPEIIVEAVDAQQNHHQLEWEVIAFYTFLPFQQLIVRLPENVNTPVLFVTVKINGSSTNTARIAIKQ